MLSIVTMTRACALFTMLTVFGPCRGNVNVYPVNISARSFEDRPATFGRDIPENGLSGELVVANPLNACIPIQSAPKHYRMGRQFFALIKESSCQFGVQVLNAQAANFKAAIIYNQDSNELKVMEGGSAASEVGIPSVFVGKYAGEQLKMYTWDTGTNIVITPFLGPPLLVYLVPFVIVVGLCFLFMAVFTMVRYYRHRVRIRRTRLSPANLKKIPCKKFKKGDEYDVCAICLDDYEEGDKLRVLPCEHVYHCKCVDPWLLEGKRTCPVCKQSVDPNKGRRRRRARRSYTVVASGSEDENENDIESDIRDADEASIASERTPLIQGSRTPRPSAPPISV